MFLLAAQNRGAWAGHHRRPPRCLEQRLLPRLQWLDLGLRLQQRLWRAAHRSGDQIRGQHPEELCDLRVHRASDQSLSTQ